MVGDGACAINPALTHEINSETVKNLAKNFKGKIVFLSTCSVYGAQEGILDESSEVNPLSEYASSKLIAEKYLADSDSIIFRLGTLFGIGDKFSRIRLDLVDQNLISATGFTKPIEITQVGSLQPTAADKLFLYAIAIPNPTVTGSTSYTTMSVPACRVGFFGTMAEEPTIEYMMRLKRSYELANQV